MKYAFSPFPHQNPIAYKSFLNYRESLLCSSSKCNLAGYSTSFVVPDDIYSIMKTLSAKCLGKQLESYTGDK